MGGKFSLFFAVFLCTLGLMACKGQLPMQSDNKIKENMSNKLTTSSWILESVVDGEGGQLISSKTFGDEIPVITFNLEDLKVQGFDGCNTFSGSFSIQRDSQIEIDKRLKSTRMFCEAVPSGAFLKALFNATQYELNANKLVLKSDTQQLMVLVQQQ
ncbi:META domain-containing protein [Myroides albus]|uniref:META domain-containing protein n=1 Tax=Myroides albus TaxID=2562892 RepID=UPI0021590AE4|nr:META domain-containing protein [Myroides albus]UVD79236.1 META domain-containing protein [Myroides albus]